MSKSEQRRVNPVLRDFLEQTPAPQAQDPSLRAQRHILRALEELQQFHESLAKEETSPEGRLEYDKFRPVAKRTEGI